MTAQTAPETVEYDDENPHPPAGIWTAGIDSSNVRGKIITSPTISHTPHSTPDANITIGVHHGVMDGKPIVWIDTPAEADFRINVNDGTVWDSGTESGEWDAIHEAAKDQLRALRLDARNHSGSALTDLLARITKLDEALGKLG